MSAGPYGPQHGAPPSYRPPSAGHALGYGPPGAGPASPYGPAASTYPPGTSAASAYSPPGVSANADPSSQAITTALNGSPYGASPAPTNILPYGAATVSTNVSPHGAEPSAVNGSSYLPPFALPTTSLTTHATPTIKPLISNTYAPDASVASPVSVDSPVVKVEDLPLEETSPSRLL